MLKDDFSSRIDASIFTNVIRPVKQHLLGFSGIEMSKPFPEVRHDDDDDDDDE